MPNTAEQMEKYLYRLKKQYEAVSAIFFCNDLAVDSVLREFVLSCYRRKIQVEVLFHEYQRKQIKPEDTAAVLSRMLDYILMGQESISAKGNEGEDHEGGTVKVQGAFVKNQLILSARLIPAEGAAVPYSKYGKEILIRG